MANSLESRAPFLDADLVELSFNIPSKLKILKNDKKILLKSILEKIELISSYYILSFDLNSLEGIIEFHGDNNKFELVLSQNNVLPVNLGESYKIQVLK